MYASPQPLPHTSERFIWRKPASGPPAIRLQPNPSQSLQPIGMPQPGPQPLGPQQPIDINETAKHVSINENRIINSPPAKMVVPCVRRTLCTLEIYRPSRLRQSNKSLQLEKFDCIYIFRDDMKLSKTIFIGLLLSASVCACTFAGCGDSNRAKIIGTWGIDQADTVMSRINNADVNSADPSGGQPATAGSPKMLLKFDRNGRLETTTAMGAVNRNKQGMWKMVSFDESTGSMTIQCDIQLQESEHEITFIDQDTIKLVPPNMAGTTMKLKFKRQ
jgi:hypothetical protein